MNASGIIETHNPEGHYVPVSLQQYMDAAYAAGGRPPPPPPPHGANPQIVPASQWPAAEVRAVVVPPPPPPPPTYYPTARLSDAVVAEHAPYIAAGGSAYACGAAPYAGCSGAGAGVAAGVAARQPRLCLALRLPDGTMRPVVLADGSFAPVGWCGVVESPEIPGGRMWILQQSPCD